jgi:hypothetical protein
MRGLECSTRASPVASSHHETVGKGFWQFREFPVEDQVGEPFQRLHVCGTGLWVSRVCVALLRPFKFFSTECAFPSQCSVREIQHNQR